VAVHRIDDGIVIVVADGSGGMAGAGRAAELVLSSVDAALRASPSTDWPRVLSLADDVIHRDRDAGETTAVVVSVSAAGAIRGASAGDSEAVVVRGESLDDLTAGQARKRRLGNGRGGVTGFERGSLDGTLIVATDGLVSYTSWEAIVRAVAVEREVEGLAAAMVELVRLPRGGFMDDIGVVVVRRGE
jgi:serine/threonine protein phosphatase PrpC